MDWGVLLTGFVSVLMLSLMLVIGSLDRKIAQHQQQVLLPEQEFENTASQQVCTSESSANQ